MDPTHPKSMRAWLYSSSRGTIEATMTLDPNAAAPTLTEQLQPDQVLVEVYFAGLNPVDYKIAENAVLTRLLVSKPASPGLDFAGRVIAVGPNSGRITDEELELRQLVFGKLDLPQKFGTLGQFIVAPRAGCAPLSDGGRLPEAASLGTVGLSAYQSIAPFAQAGSNIFIHGGSGGTGTCGIQIAKELGCYVVTTCSGRNVDYCRSLGADEVIDYTETDILSALRGQGRLFDVIVDNAGMNTNLYRNIWEVAKPDANFVQVAGDPDFSTAVKAVSRLLWIKIFGGQKKLHYLGVKNQYAQLTELEKWLQGNRLRLLVEEVFRFEDAPRAFEKLKSHQGKGKIVVKMSDKV
ncbi:hypothetical protein LTR56_026950 [Elasticomyces elasticus]|nr:hypothetical protein LTR56_026950 [Elasticomyces elasticus]KAK5722146.1 hypothetical protein LTS12_027577 [Elasticomyces elasticus]